MNPVERLDFWILGRIQQFSNRIYELVSLTNFMIARILLVISVICALFEASTKYLGNPNDQFGPLSGLFFSLYIAHRQWMTYDLLRYLGTFAHVEMMTTLRQLYTCLLPFMLYWSLDVPESPITETGRRPEFLHVSGWFYIGWAVAVWLSFYFGSCKQPPKKKSKAKEALEKAEAWWQGLWQPAPQIAMNARSPRPRGLPLFYN